MGILDLFSRPEAEELYDEYDNYDYDEGYEEDYRANNYRSSRDSYRTQPEPASYETPGAQPIRSLADMQIATVKPKEYADAATIASMLRDMKLVVMNVEEVKENNPDDVWRILDFLSGVAYSEDGHVMKVGEDVYVAAPYFVDLIDRSDDMFASDRAEMLYY